MNGIIIQKLFCSDFALVTMFNNLQCVGRSFVRSSTWANNDLGAFKSSSLTYLNTKTKLDFLVFLSFLLGQQHACVALDHQRYNWISQELHFLLPLSLSLSLSLVLNLSHTFFSISFSLSFSTKGTNECSTNTTTM